jgi:nickel-dependent lactate racemase
MTPLTLHYGQSTCTLAARADDLLTLHRAAPPPGTRLAPGAATAAALEHPLHLPALRRALTPDDSVAVVLDPQLPAPVAHLSAVLEHLASANLALERVTIVSPPDADQSWLDELPDELADVHLERHDPVDRNRLAYLATTTDGRRVYLNRTVVEADQTILLTGRRYDALTEYGGGASVLFPALSDAETRGSFWDELTVRAPALTPGKLRQLADEVAWLLGSPFLVQVLPGASDAVHSVLVGLLDTASEGLRLYNRLWHGQIDGPADMVIAPLSGTHGHDFAALARAAVTAARVVRKGGRIVVLTEATPNLGPGAKLLQQLDRPSAALKQLALTKPSDYVAAYQWAQAARRAHLFVLSGWDEETTEALYATQLQHARQVQRLLDAAGTSVLIADAHHALVTRSWKADEA